MLSLLLAVAKAELVVETFDTVPVDIQCGETWTNQSIIFGFSETIASEGSSPGRCSFGVGSGYVDLYPSRFLMDFSLLQYPVSRIEADIQVYGQTGLFAYEGTNNIGETTSPVGGAFSLDFSAQHPDLCAIRSSEGRVVEIRVYTLSPPLLSILETNRTLAVVWPTNDFDWFLESSPSLSIPSAWAQVTNGISADGTNFVYHPGAPIESEFFRLRQN